ncbi:hypothetical protein ACI68E_000394 [Malassezia pachydermatis]
MNYSDTPPAVAMLPDPTVAVGSTSHKKLMKEQRRRRRRMQLAAALIEADNDDIQRRIDILNEYDPSSQDILEHLRQRSKHASESVMFRDAGAIDVSNARPVYTYPLMTMREVTQGYFGMSAQWASEGLEEETGSVIEHDVDEEPALPAFDHDDFGSPVMDVLQRADSIQARAAQEAETPIPPRPLHRSASMPMLTEKKEDVELDENATRGDLLLHRIQAMRQQATPKPDESTSSGDVSLSRSSVNVSDTSHSSAAIETPEMDGVMFPVERELQGKEPPVETSMEMALGIHVDGATSDLKAFRERVLNKESGRQPSGRRHSLSVSGWPGEMHPVAEEMGLLYGQEDDDEEAVEEAAHPRMLTKQLQALGRADSYSTKRSTMGELTPYLERHQSVHSHDLSSSTWKRDKKSFWRRFGKRGTMPAVRVTSGASDVVRTAPPNLQELSPLMDMDESMLQTLPLVTVPGEDEMTGVNLLSPNPNVQPGQAASEHGDMSKPNRGLRLFPWRRRASAPPAATLYESNQLRSTRPKDWVPTYICIPAPLSSLPVVSHDTQSYFVPRGAFAVEHGVILPANNTVYDGYAPTEIPAHMGRRALYPSTALFRNVLATREEEHEGWGWDVYTDTPQYFADLAADDDDSDDEVPLMDVRILAREEALAEKRRRREHRRRRRANQSERASHDSDDDAADISSYDSDGSTTSSGTERPWRDDRRPVGRLYGQNLMDMAAKEQHRKRAEYRFYGQAPLHGDDGSEPHAFTNDTRERMRRLFGEQTQYQDEWERRLVEDGALLPRRSSTRATKREELVTMLEPGLEHAIVYPAPEDVAAIQETVEKNQEESRIEAWLDSSDDEEPAERPGEGILAPKVGGHRAGPFGPAVPRWLAKDEDDVPLSTLQRRSAVPSDEDDAVPLGARHPQAEIIAEKDALIRQLLEENRQVKRWLHSRSSMLPAPVPPPYGNPWASTASIEAMPSVPYDEVRGLFDMPGSLVASRDFDHPVPVAMSADEMHHSGAMEWNAAMDPAARKRFTM